MNERNLSQVEIDNGLAKCEASDEGIALGAGVLADGGNEVGVVENELEKLRKAHCASNGRDLQRRSHLVALATRRPGEDGIGVVDLAVEGPKGHFNALLAVRDDEGVLCI
jgi:hypothetical protein